MDIGASFGDKLGWTGGQASVPVTNLTPHVDGGESAVNVSGTMAPSDDQNVILYGGAGVVAGAIVLLWFFGAFALKGVPSL